MVSECFREYLGQKKKTIGIDSHQAYIHDTPANCQWIWERYYLDAGRQCKYLSGYTRQENVNSFDVTPCASTGWWDPSRLEAEEAWGQGPRVRMNVVMVSVTGLCWLSVASRLNRLIGFNCSCECYFLKCGGTSINKCDFEISALNPYCSLSQRDEN